MLLGSEGQPVDIHERQILKQKLINKLTSMPMQNSCKTFRMQENEEGCLRLLLRLMNWIRTSLEETETKKSRTQGDINHRIHKTSGNRQREGNNEKKNVDHVFRSIQIYLKCSLCTFHQSFIIVNSQLNNYSISPLAILEVDLESSCGTLLPRPDSQRLHFQDPQSPFHKLLT